MSSITLNINALLNKVKERIGNPVNLRVVVATIESFGIRAMDVKTDYGMNSIDELALYIFDSIKLDSPNELKNTSEKQKFNKEAYYLVSDYLAVKAKLFLYYFPLGLLHMFPVFLQILAIVIFGYSLWTYLGFNNLQSTAVVFGVIFGLVLTGGIVQVIGRQASFYWYHSDLPMAKKTIYRLIALGLKSLLIAFIIITVLNSFFNLYPFQFLFIVFMYSFLIGTLILFLAPMHTIKQRWVVSVAILVATIIAVLLKTKTSLNTYITHWVGISIAIIIMWGYISYFFRKIKVKALKLKTIDTSMVIVYKNYNYFIYGTFIYIFIFIDRLVAWSTSVKPLPFIIFYERNYEIGMDIAILVFFLLAGIMEYNIAVFAKFLNILVKTTSLNSIEQFNKNFYTNYVKQIILLLVTSVIIFILIYIIIEHPKGYQAYFDESLNNISKEVSKIGSVGYLFLTWGMLNSLYLFSLNQPKIPVKAITISIIVNLIVGILLSRTVVYYYSSIGMLVGSFVFMIITLIECRKYFKNLDYYYNASY